MYNRKINCWKHIIKCSYNEKCTNHEDKEKVVKDASQSRMIPTPLDIDIFEWSGISHCGMDKLKGESKRSLLVSTLESS